MKPKDTPGGSGIDGRGDGEAGVRVQRDGIAEILESISDAFYAVDSEYRFTYVNKRAGEMWGRSPQDLLGKTLWDEFPQAVGSEAHRMHLQAMRERKPVQFEALSSVIGQWVDVSIYPEASGGLSCYFRDISESKRAQEALRESEARYRTLFESIDEGFCVIEVILDEEGRPKDFRFLEVNPAFVAQTGLHDAEGRLMRDLVPEHEDHWFEIYGEVALTGEPVRFTNHAAQLRGGVWYDVNAFRIGGEGSRRVGVLFEDITERIQREEENRRLNERLESLVEDRTRQLTRAVDDLESFNYSVSHDLRAPLRGVDGFAKALEEEYGDLLDETGRAYLQRVRAGAQRMGVLIDDLLRLSRLSRSTLESGEVNLAALAREIVDELQRREPERKVEVEIAPDLECEGDEGLLRVALENLLENAWKFTSEREIAHIEVGSTEVDGVPVFFVQDDGAGFDQQFANKLFAPFGRLHGKDRFGGTGVGLAMVQRIVSLHGGRVWGEGAVDQGAVFYFSLPAVEAGEEDQASDDEEPAQAATG